MSKSSGLAKLTAAAAKRRDARSRKTRIAVQIGHCSQAVGAIPVAEAIRSSLDGDSYVVDTGCDGGCFDAPQVLVTDSSGETRRYGRLSPELALRIVEGDADQRIDSGFYSNQCRITLDGCGEMDVANVDDYILRGGYKGLEQALSMSPDDVIDEVESSGLRGRGGAYFPAAVKWRSTRRTDAVPRHLVVNCEEGEPGVFKDRHLMEGVPHRILEGAIVAAYASAAAHAWVYVNAEAELSARRMHDAIGQAYDAGLLGQDILGSGFSLDVKVRRGAGGYVCGEEMALLNTMEGYRREPRIRPPFPTEAGFLGKPTAVNNAETLASVPSILSGGAAAFKAVGTADSAGTKIVSISGSVRRPGAVEVPFGTTLRRILYDIGGGPLPGHSLGVLAVGGPSSGVLPPSMIDIPIAPGLLHESGVMLGAGGIAAMDERVSALDVVRSLAAYNADESCGKCTPCREGTPRMVEALDRLTSGSGAASDLDNLRYLAEVVGPASLCGLGQAAGAPINSALHFFGDELAGLAGGAR